MIKPWKSFAPDPPVPDPPDEMPEPTTVYICEYCGQAIVLDEPCWEIDDGYYDVHWHDDCFQFDAVDICRTYLNARKSVAELR